MAVAFDAIGPGASGTGTLTWTHTPVGTPKGILVFIWQLTGVDQVSAAPTYAGTNMTEVALSPVLKTNAEAMAMYCYALTTGITTGAQTVSVTVSGAATKVATSISYTTAANDTEIIDTSIISSDAVANPTVTVSLGGRTCAVVIAGVSGQDAVSGIAPSAGWTDRGESDLGTYTIFTYTYDTVSTADVTAGWTQTSEDAAAIAVAISEVVSGGATAVPVFYNHLREQGIV